MFKCNRSGVSACLRLRSARDARHSLDRRPRRWPRPRTTRRGSPRSSASEVAAQAERERVGVVPAPRAGGGGGVGAERGAHARDLVGGDRRAGAGPAADDRPAARGPSATSARGGLRGPGPLGALRGTARRSAPCSADLVPARPQRARRSTAATPTRSSAATAIRIGRSIDAYRAGRSPPWLHGPCAQLDSGLEPSFDRGC